MIMNYGRCAETLKMRNKPIGSGFEIWTLCNSAHFFTTFPHSNQDCCGHCASYKGRLINSSTVVAKLVEQLPRKVPFSRITEYTLCFSRKVLWFVKSVSFTWTICFQRLKSFRTSKVTTVLLLVLWDQMPLVFPNHLLSEVKRASICRVTLWTEPREDGAVPSTWIDNGAVQLLTMKHAVGHRSKVERSRKHPRQT